MTNKDAVQLIDPTAKFNVWGDKGDKTGWVHGNGWETKIHANEQNAWVAAVEIMATKKVAA